MPQCTECSRYFINSDSNFSTLCQFCIKELSIKQQAAIARLDSDKISEKDKQVDEALDRAEWNQNLKDFVCALVPKLQGNISKEAVEIFFDAAELMCTEYEKRMKK